MGASSASSLSHSLRLSVQRSNKTTFITQRQGQKSRQRRPGHKSHKPPGRSSQSLRNPLKTRSSKVAKEVSVTAGNCTPTHSRAVICAAPKSRQFCDLRSLITAPSPCLQVRLFDTVEVSNQNNGKPFQAAGKERECINQAAQPRRKSGEPSRFMVIAPSVVNIQDAPVFAL